MGQTIAVCRKCKDYACLVRVLEAHGHVTLELVRCQKICHGPVVGVPIAGRMEWFERVSRVKEIAALLRVAKKGRRDSIPKALKRRRVKRHAGRPVRT